MSETPRLPVKPSEIERVLRTAGLSRQQAKRLLAGGLQAAGLDVAEDEQQVEVRALIDELREAARLLRGEGAFIPSDADP